MSVTWNTLMTDHDTLYKNLEMAGLQGRDSRIFLMLGLIKPGVCLMMKLGSANLVSNFFPQKKSQ